MKKLTLIIIIFLSFQAIIQSQWFSRRGDSSTNVNLYNYAHEDSTNTLSRIQTFTAADSSIITKGIKGLTGEIMLKLFSPGNGHQGIGIYNSTVSNSIYFYTGNGAALYTLTNNYFYLGDGSTGKPLISHDAPTTSAVSYSFYGDRNTGLLWNSADNISLVTGGTARVAISSTVISLTLPTAFAQMDETARDALTPAAGWVIWNTTSGRLQVFNGITWNDLH